MGGGFTERGKQDRQFENSFCTVVEWAAEYFGACDAQRRRRTDTAVAEGRQNFFFF